MIKDLDRRRSPGEDSTDDPSPVVLEDGAVCFTEADAATVVVSVGMGKGSLRRPGCGATSRVASETRAVLSKDSP